MILLGDNMRCVININGRPRDITQCEADGLRDNPGVMDREISRSVTDHEISRSVRQTDCEITRV